MTDPYVCLQYMNGVTWPPSTKTPSFVHHFSIRILWEPTIIGHVQHQTVTGWWFLATPLKNDGVRQLG